MHVQIYIANCLSYICAGTNRIACIIVIHISAKPNVYAVSDSVGVIYERWGRTECPGTATLVYMKDLLQVGWHNTVGNMELNMIPLSTKQPCLCSHQTGCMVILAL